MIYSKDNNLLVVVNQYYYTLLCTKILEIIHLTRKFVIDGGCNRAAPIVHPTTQVLRKEYPKDAKIVSTIPNIRCGCCP